MSDENQMPADGQRIVLILQGGGALGAYQAGVYQALEERGYTPEWVIGTSIGAVNAALIAGNPPGERLTALRGFWGEISSIDLETLLPSALRHQQLFGFLNALRVELMGEPNMFTPRILPSVEGCSAETASIYDTRPLRRTLEKYIDFDHLNTGDVQLSVGAASVTRGELVYFDNTSEGIGSAHILASCSLPPGFPATRIDDDVFWDGGVCSNTPLHRVLSEEPHTDSLCFAVNLWNERGAEPASLPDVLAREKEIRYCSRFEDEIRMLKTLHILRNAIQALYEALPEDQRRKEEIRPLGELGSRAKMDVVRLSRNARDWELATKDINFSRTVIDEHWSSGYRDACRVLDAAPWQRERNRHEGVMVHDPAAREARG